MSNLLKNPPPGGNSCIDVFGIENVFVTDQNNPTHLIRDEPKRIYDTKNMTNFLYAVVCDHLLGRKHYKLCEVLPNNSNDKFCPVFHFRFSSSNYMEMDDFYLIGKIGDFLKIFSRGGVLENGRELLNSYLISDGTVCKIFHGKIILERNYKLIFPGMKTTIETYEKLCSVIFCLLKKDNDTTDWLNILQVLKPGDTTPLPFTHSNFLPVWYFEMTPGSKRKITCFDSQASLVKFMRYCSIYYSGRNQFCLKLDSVWKQLCPPLEIHFTQSVSIVPSDVVENSQMVDKKSLLNIMTKLVQHITLGSDDIGLGYMEIGMIYVDESGNIILEPSWGCCTSCYCPIKKISHDTCTTYYILKKKGIFGMVCTQCDKSDDWILPEDIMGALDFQYRGKLKGKRLSVRVTNMDMINELREKMTNYNNYLSQNHIINN